MTASRLTMSAKFLGSPQIVDAASCRVAAAGSRCHFFAGFRRNISKQALKHEFSEVWRSRTASIVIRAKRSNFLDPDCFVADAPRNGKSPSANCTTTTSLSIPCRGRPAGSPGVCPNCLTRFLRGSRHEGRMMRQGDLKDSEQDTRMQCES